MGDKNARTMSMPGFGAEEGLGASRQRYRTSTAGSAAAGAVVQPQLQLLPRPKGNCIPGCICVSPINCPCCNSWWPWPWPIGGELD